MTDLFQTAERGDRAAAHIPSCGLPHQRPDGLSGRTHAPDRSPARRFGIRG